VSFVFSGSEKSTLLALYEDPKAPLHGLGRRFPLPEISPDDWYAGLRERFERCGIAIERERWSRDPPPRQVGVVSSPRTACVSMRLEVRICRATSRSWKMRGSRTA